MPRVKFRRFESGWWPAGAPEDAPSSTLRRARGIHPTYYTALRSRWGSVRLDSLGAPVHSLFRFAGARFAGIGGRLYRNGVEIKNGLDGSRLTFMPMAPTAGLKDWLFVAGGGELFKVDDAGAVTKWGIKAPTTDPVQTDIAAGVLNGIYQYRVTFRNAATGHRSNANPSDVETANLTNRQIRLSNIPTSTDPQVSQRELWRTVGNGTIKFKLATITDNTTTTFNDNTADAALGSEELPDDNDVPEPTFDDVVGPFQARAWWSRDSRSGNKGRVFYSPVGRPEALEEFLQVSSDHDETQKAVFWNGVLWVLTTSAVHQVLGSGPYTTRSVTGAPGTTAPHTVVATPLGIVYEAEDGIRLFDGNVSRLVGDDALGLLFTGEALGGVGAFSGVVATYRRQEYIVSDGSETLALNLRRRSWRVVGVGSSALHAEHDTGMLQAAFDDKVFHLEVDGVTTDDGNPIRFEPETPGILTDAIEPGIIQRVEIELTTRGESLTPTLVLDDVETVLPLVESEGRETVELPINKSARTASLRLTGDVTKQVEVHGVEFHIYVPERPQAERPVAGEETPRSGPVEVVR